MDDYPQLQQSIEIEARLRESFTHRALHLLLDVIAQSYATVSESQAPYDCFDNQTFGFCLWRASVNMLKKAAYDSPHLLKVTKSAPEFVMQVGEYELATYRVASHGNADIMHSFPSSNGAVRTMLPNSYLPGLEPDIREAKRVILAHMGNAQDLLGAAYLCIPTSLGNDDRISEWGFALPVLIDGALVVGDTAVPNAQPEVITPTELKRKREVGNVDSAS